MQSESRMSGGAYLVALDEVKGRGRLFTITVQLV